MADSPPAGRDRQEGAVRSDPMPHRRIEVNALLWLTSRSESEIARFLMSIGVPAASVRRGMHLTVYHGRRLLPGMRLRQAHVSIAADVKETRFMVMVPGGEVRRPGVDPKQCSVGVRLTRRNVAIPEIQRLREGIYRYETEDVVKGRHPTTAWRNCFGARRYQPHVTFVRPGNRLPPDLTATGRSFRASLSTIEFDRFEVRLRIIDKNRRRPPRRFHRHTQVPTSYDSKT